MVNNKEIEDFIKGWNYDEETYLFSYEMGQFLLEFSYTLENKNLSYDTIKKHRSNSWIIGFLECNYGFNQKFKPDIFSGSPNYTYEFKRKFSDTKYAINSYSSTWKKIIKYMKTLE
ncbi:MAG: hypothetical protein AABZ74_00945 [Cyanobacteriota bacterium]